MAVHLVRTDGNSNVAVEGAWNYGGPDVSTYTPGLSGATALGIVFTLQPDMPLPTVGTFATNFIPLCHQANPGTSSQLFYILYNVVTRQLFFRVFTDGSAAWRSGTSAADLLTAGVVHRMVWRWRAAPETMTLAINGVACPLTLSDTPIAHLNSNPFALTAPLALGDMDSYDAAGLGSVVQQWATTNTYITDADAALYGTTGNPGAMATAWQHWVSLAQASITTVHAENFWGNPSPYMALLGLDLATGFNYDAHTFTYNYGGGNYTMPGSGIYATLNTTAFAVVPDLSASAGVAAVDDRRMLPVEWFELEELNGQCGRRDPSRNIAVPSEMNFRDACTAIQYGGDIVIDHTATGIEITGWYLLGGKTVDANTPRMPPHQKRPITMGRPLTSAH